MAEDPDIKRALRYVTPRPNADGTIRWYWDRPGHKLQRLPADFVERVAKARSLNMAADGSTLVAEHSVAWLIGKYRASDKYKKLAPSSMAIYGRWLDEYEAMWGALPAAAITRRVVMEFKDSLDGKPATQSHAIAVLSSLMKIAYRYDLVPANPCEKPDIRRNAPRDVVWQDDEFTTFLDSCDDKEFLLPFNLLRYTGQRPIDVCHMAWTRYNGDTIRLVQQKTKKLLEVPCHTELRAFLDRLPRRSTVICLRRDGKPYTREHLTYRFSVLRKECGLDRLQLRDLRRTACVRLAEAGATVPQIAAVTGHEIETTTRILKAYIPTNTAMARAAIRCLEQWESEKANALA